MVCLMFMCVNTLGSLDVNAVGSLTKWTGNRSTTSLFSWSIMFTIFLSSLINIFKFIVSGTIELCFDLTFWVQIPEVFSMASSLRIPSAGYTRSFSGDTVNVAKCSNKYAGDRPPEKIAWFD